MDSDGDGDAAAGSIFGQTKPAEPTQPSSSSLVSGFGPTPGAQTPSAVSFPNLQTPQQGTSNIFGAAPSSFGQPNAFGLQQPPQNVVSIPSTSVTNPFGTLPAMPQITISGSASSGPSVQYGISSMPVSSLPPYSYRPLDIGQNEIRLLKLQAPIKSQPLCGNIIHVPLSAELRYWALILLG